MAFLLGDLFDYDIVVCQFTPCFVLPMIAAVASTTQATKTIKGTVTGVDKEPLIGVLITVKGTAPGSDYRC